MNAEEQIPPVLSPAISVRGLHRNFGKVKAVDGVDFDIPRGAVVGFIGANGAGKTTTMRMLATLEVPDQGEVLICGLDAAVFPTEVRHRIGWMPDKYGAYLNMTVLDYLDFHARAFGLSGAARRERMAEVMEFTDLGPITDRDVRALSKGMAQRLCLGRTLLHDPDVLIMDEPAAGLDPKARIEFKNLIALLAQRGKTMFISSHILSELGEMCDTMLFIDRGRIVHQGTSDSLLHSKEAGATVEVVVAGDVENLLTWVELNPGVVLLAKQRNGARLHFDSADPADLAANLKRIVSAGNPVVEFHREEMKLEEAFVEMLKKLEGNP